MGGLLASPFLTPVFHLFLAFLRQNYTELLIVAVLLELRVDWGYSEFHYHYASFFWFGRGKLFGCGKMLSCDQQGVVTHQGRSLADVILAFIATVKPKEFNRDVTEPAPLRPIR